MAEAFTGVLDSRLFRDLFSTTAMRAIFRDEAVLQAWLDAEVALAQAQADCGLIPHTAAKAIERQAVSANFDLDDLRAEMNETGHPLIATIHALEDRCGSDGVHVHFGATTQDIMDTGQILQTRQGLELTEQQLADFLSAAGVLCEHHKATPMCARTHGQVAVPTTFGFKIAVIADEMRRHLERLQQLRPRLLTGSLHGAAGTLATLGAHGGKVRQIMMDRLDLGVTDVPNHTARDALAECVFSLALIGSTAGKLANEIVNLQRSEIAEVAESTGPASVGSSTMPQKRNPMSAQTIVTLSRLLRRLPSIMLEAMQHEHERDFAAWQAEWAAIPESFVLTSAILERATALLVDLHVDTDRMAENLARTGGLINAEAVMMKLAPALGRSKAHHLVNDAVTQSARTGTPFLDCLRAQREIASVLRPAEIEAILRPEAWLGEAVIATERVLAKLSRV
jgi:adenylosuccinate lyase